jgi:hypothetical protein
MAEGLINVIPPLDAAKPGVAQLATRGDMSFE